LLQEVRKLNGFSYGLPVSLLECAACFGEGMLAKTIQFDHRHKSFEFKLTDDGAVELYLDNCLRKRRERSAREPQYVWTNVELEWEEHHYIEIRYWASSGQLLITVNGDVLIEREI
jgi:hypothetical protein